MLLYEYRRRNSMIYFRPSFRIRAHLNPILRTSRAIRIIRRKIAHPTHSTLLIPRKSRLLPHPIKIKVF